MASRSVLALLFVVVGFACAARGGERISGGYDTSIETYPMAVQVEAVVGLSWVHSCAGSILNSQYILSAAQCFNGVVSIFDRRVRYGSGKRGTGGEVSGVSNVITHPDFDSSTLEADITLVRLSTQLSFNGQTQPGIITAGGFYLPGSIPVTLIGWGNIDAAGSTAKVLQELSSLTIDREVCAEFFNEDDNETTEGPISTYTWPTWTPSTTEDFNSTGTTEGPITTVDSNSTWTTWGPNTTEDFNSTRTTEGPITTVDSNSTWTTWGPNTTEDFNSTRTTEGTITTVDSNSTWTTWDPNTTEDFNSTRTTEGPISTVDSNSTWTTWGPNTTEDFNSTRTTEGPITTVDSNSTWTTWGPNTTEDFNSTGTTARPITTEDSNSTWTTWGPNTTEDSNSTWTTEGSNSTWTTNSFNKRSKRNTAITESMLCIGDLETRGVGACDGDVGGGVIFHSTVGDVTSNILVGVVSQFGGCGNGTTPTVATAITSYTSWIIANAV